MRQTVPGNGPSALLEGEGREYNGLDWKTVIRNCWSVAALVTATKWVWPCRRHLSPYSLQRKNESVGREILTGNSTSFSIAALF